MGKMMMMMMIFPSSPCLSLSQKLLTSLVLERCLLPGLPLLCLDLLLEESPPLDEELLGL